MKVLKLPYLVQKKIMGDMDLSYVVILSMMNKRMKRLLDACRITIDQWSWEATDVLTLKTKEYGTVRFEFMRQSPASNDSTMRLKSGSVIVTVQNSDSDLMTTFDVNFVDERRKSLELKMQLNEVVSRFLFGFINPKYFDLSIDKKFSDFFVRLRFHVSEDDLKFVLDKVTADTMELNVKCPTVNFKFERPNMEVKQNSIIVGKTNFFHFESFIDTLNSTKITALCHSTECINRILKGWIQGRNNITEFMRLIFHPDVNRSENDSEDEDENDDEDNNQNYNDDNGDGISVTSDDFVQPEDELTEDQIRTEILEGINVTTPTFTEKQWRTRFARQPMDTASEIRRPSDDRKAAIIFGYKFLEVNVWTDRHLRRVQAIQNS